jgi:hypothetical protein
VTPAACPGTLAGQPNDGLTEGAIILKIPPYLGVPSAGVWGTGEEGDSTGVDGEIEGEVTGSAEVGEEIEWEVVTDCAHPPKTKVTASTVISRTRIGFLIAYFSLNFDWYQRNDLDHISIPGYWLQLLNKLLKVNNLLSRRLLEWLNLHLFPREIQLPLLINSKRKFETTVIVYAIFTNNKYLKLIQWIYLITYILNKMSLILVKS